MIGRRGRRFRLPRRRRSLAARLRALLPDWAQLPNWRWLPWYEPPRPKRRVALRALDVFAYLGTAWLLLRPWLRRIGANEAELRKTYPGDELFGHAEVITRAITIEARAADIWPWIVQMGWGRAGWYSVDLIDNLGRRSAQRILPEFQHLDVGDEIPSSARTAFRVHDIEPERFLVLTFDGNVGSASWLFWLEPIDDNHTRLVERIRGHASSNPLIQFAQLLGDAGDVVMMMTHLHSLKRRAERTAEERISRAVAGAEPPPWDSPDSADQDDGDSAGGDTPSEVPSWSSA